VRAGPRASAPERALLLPEGAAQRVRVVLRGSRARVREPVLASRSGVLVMAQAGSLEALAPASGVRLAGVPREPAALALRLLGWPRRERGSKGKSEPNESKETSEIDELTSSRSITLRVCEVVSQARVAAIQQVFGFWDCFRNGPDIDDIDVKRDRTIVKMSRHTARVSGVRDTC
jgi:hypothetical protein